MAVGTDVTVGCGSGMDVLDVATCAMPVLSVVTDVLASKVEVADGTALMAVVVATGIVADVTGSVLVAGAAGGGGANTDGLAVGVAGASVDWLDELPHICVKDKSGGVILPLDADPTPNTQPFTAPLVTVCDPAPSGEYFQAPFTR